MRLEMEVHVQCTEKKQARNQIASKYLACKIHPLTE